MAANHPPRPAEGDIPRIPSLGVSQVESSLTHIPHKIPKSTSLPNSHHWSPGPTENGMWMALGSKGENGRPVQKAAWQTLLKHPACDTQHKDSLPTFTEEDQTFSYLNDAIGGLGVRGLHFSPWFCLTSGSSLGTTFRDFSWDPHLLLSKNILLDFNLVATTIAKNLRQLRYRHQLFPCSFFLGTSYARRD